MTLGFFVLNELAGCYEILIFFLSSYGLILVNATVNAIVRLKIMFTLYVLATDFSSDKMLKI